MEDDKSADTVAQKVKKFQSTSSVWRTTEPPLQRPSPTAAFQSTSSVWRTTKAIASGTGPQAISIHVLRVEDDLTTPKQIRFLEQFQSTSSVWRTTQARQALAGEQAISIHVLRVEDDTRS